MKRSRAGMIFVFLMAGITSAFAQAQGTQYFMNSLPEVSINNPAFVPQYNFSIGVPVFSSVSAGYYNNGFSYNDVITKSNGEVKADLSKLLKSLTANNYIMTTASVDLLRVGFRVTPKLYFQLSSTGNSYQRALVPKEAASLLVNGNAPLIGSSTSFSPKVEGMEYVETALAMAYSLNNQVTFGIRAKYLMGIASATTIRSSMDLTVGSAYQLTAVSDLQVKTSGIQDNSNDFSKMTSNSGVAVDLGVNVKLTDRLSVAASVIDLGKISWQNNLYSYTLDKSTANYTFSGVDLQQVVAGNSDYLKAQGDSIQAKFKPKENKINSFGTPMPIKMFFSGKYDIKKDLNVGALFFMESFHDRLNPSGTLALTKHVGKWFSTSLSYTASNRSYNNFGAGVSFNLKPIQIYFVGDNILGAAPSLIAHQNLNNYINNTQVFNMRFGINIIWGRDKSLDESSKNSKNYGKTAAGKKVAVTSGDQKSLSPQKSKKSKTTTTGSSYLKARKKRK